MAISRLKLAAAMSVLTFMLALPDGCVSSPFPTPSTVSTTARCGSAAWDIAARASDIALGNYGATKVSVVEVQISGGGWWVIAVSRGYETGAVVTNIMADPEPSFLVMVKVTDKWDGATPIDAVPRSIPLWNGPAAYKDALACLTSSPVPIVWPDDPPMSSCQAVPATIVDRIQEIVSIEQAVSMAVVESSMIAVAQWRAIAIRLNDGDMGVWLWRTPLNSSDPGRLSRLDTVATNYAGVAFPWAATAKEKATACIA